MENKKERIYTTSEKLREAKKRYYEKIKNTDEYKQKCREYQREYIAKDKERYNDYQRNYQRTVYYPKVKEEGRRKNKYLEQEIDSLLPILIKTI